MALLKVKVAIKTLRATKSKFLRPALEDHRGLSLIEILIVLGLLSLVVGIAVPSLTGAFRTSKQSFARQTALLLREARDRALLRDKLIRLRIDLEKQQYWLEEAPSSYLLPKPPEKKLTDREQEEFEKKEAEVFVQVNDLTGGKRDMPNGLRIYEVESPRLKGVITEGVADVYFYSNGNTDGAMIRFEDDEQNRQTLIIHPITGQTKVELGAKESEK